MVWGTRKRGDMWPRARDRATQCHDGYTGLHEAATRVGSVRSDGNGRMRNLTPDSLSFSIFSHQQQQNTAHVDGGAGALVASFYPRTSPETTQQPTTCLHKSGAATQQQRQRGGTTMAMLIRRNESKNWLFTRQSMMISSVLFCTCRRPSRSTPCHCRAQQAMAGKQNQQWGEQEGGH
jgi:hypothetical protein